jgi:plasmid stabilization system protein ParE
LNVALHPEALAELEDQASWYETRRRGLGFELLAEVRGTLQRLVDHPELGAAITQAAPARRITLASFPLSIVYLVRDEELFVIAVAHARRRPGYWRGRL